MISFNFFQIQGSVWEVRTQSVVGGSFSALTSSFDEARLMFLRRMWGGKSRPDRLSFEQWQQAYPYVFHLRG